MPVIGITGGISTGKTSFCDCLREFLPGAKFFDADQAARDLTKRDAEVKELLREEFGTEIFSASGDLNRTRLRAIVFADAAKRTALEQILHPRIRRQWSAQAEIFRQSAEFFLADIPLLYETDGEALCDRVVVVACSRETQLKRLMQRGMGFQPMSAHRLEANATTEAEKIISSQMPLAEKIARADHVVWNNGERSVLLEQAKLLAEFWQQWQHG